MDTLERVQVLAEDIEHNLNFGHLAIAGGYCRDLCLGLVPKDLDIFVDGTLLNNLTEAARLGERVCRFVEDGARVERTFASYGNWAADVEGVVQIKLPIKTHACGCPIPENIDLVFMRPDRLKLFGFQGDSGTFLDAVCKRVDLRLNALGATTGHIRWDLRWDEDRINRRLVVQQSRLAPDTADDMKRITKRLKRLTETKFQGYGIYFEQPNGTLDRESLTE